MAYVVVEGDFGRILLSAIVEWAFDSFFKFFHRLPSFNYSLNGFDFLRKLADFVAHKVFLALNE
jgi:hypothetical protein